MSTINPSEELKDTPKLIVSNTPTSITDRVIVAVASDGTVLMRFISAIPDLTIENHRTVLRADVAKSLINTMCMTTGYYPQKPKKKAPKKKAPKNTK